MDDLVTDRITLHKRDGTDVLDVPASVQGEKVYILQERFPVEEGDQLERSLPNGTTEFFDVLHVDFYSGIGGDSGHFKLTVEKSHPRIRRRPRADHSTPSPPPTALPSSPMPGDVWDLLHPEIVGIARSRYEAGHYADAVEAAFKLVNGVVKTVARERTSLDLDGAKLMQRVFSVKEPVIRLADLGDETGRSIQIGYMQLFAGAMTGIRNPKAHGLVNIDSERAIHFLFLASLLRSKLEDPETDVELNLGSQPPH